MIIFGTSVRKKTVGNGEFFCPRCGTKRSFERKAAKRYFTLYFIPLIPIGDAGEYMECTTCHMLFEPAVLGLKPKPIPQNLAQQLNTLKSRLENGAPVEYAVRDMTAAGLERSTAQQNVDNAIGTERRICKNCMLTYANNVTTCSECNGLLEPTS
jgi:hypothetical protein